MRRPVAGHANMKAMTHGRESSLHSCAACQQAAQQRRKIREGAMGDFRGFSHVIESSQGNRVAPSGQVSKSRRLRRIKSAALQYQ